MSAQEAQAEVKKLARRLQNAAYRHGQIDSEDRWSNKKYREADETANAAYAALVEYVAERAAEPQPDSGVNLWEALNAALEFIEPYVDTVDGDYGAPKANRAMTIVKMLKDEIEKVERA